MHKLSFFAAFFGLCFVCVTDAVGTTDSTCKIENKYINFQVIKSKAKQDRIAFRDVKDPLKTDAREMKTYLLPGDLVTTDDIGTITKYGKKPKPNFICVEYRATTGRAVRGWISSDNLLQVVNANSPDEQGAFNQYPEEIKSILKSLSTPISIPAGTLWRNGSHRKDDNPFEIRLNLSSDKKSPSFKFADLPISTFKYRIGSTFLNPTSPTDKCGISALLFNNALVIRSEVSGVCWGNHGDSNPDGAYYSK